MLGLANVHESRAVRCTVTSSPTLSVSLAMQKVLERVPATRLTKADARTAARIAGLHLAMSHEAPD